MEVVALQHQILATMASRVTVLGKRKLGFLGLFGPSIESVDHWESFRGVSVRTFQVVYDNLPSVKSCTSDERRNTSGLKYTLAQFVGWLFNVKAFFRYKQHIDRLKPYVDEQVISLKPTKRPFSFQKNCPEAWGRFTDFLSVAENVLNFPGAIKSAMHRADWVNKEECTTAFAEAVCDHLSHHRYGAYLKGQILQHIIDDINPPTPQAGASTGAGAGTSDSSQPSTVFESNISFPMGTDVLEILHQYVKRPEKCEHPRMKSAVTFFAAYLEQYQVLIRTFQAGNTLPPVDELLRPAKKAYRQLMLAFSVDKHQQAPEAEKARLEEFNKEINEVKAPAEDKLRETYIRFKELHEAGVSIRDKARAIASEHLNLTAICNLFITQCYGKMWEQDELPALNSYMTRMFDENAKKLQAIGEVIDRQHAEMKEHNKEMEKHHKEMKEQNEERQKHNEEMREREEEISADLQAMLIELRALVTSLLADPEMAERFQDNPVAQRYLPPKSPTAETSRPVSETSSQAGSAVPLVDDRPDSPRHGETRGRTFSPPPPDAAEEVVAAQQAASDDDTEVLQYKK